MVRVYDLINAGPRHRFTASGKVVSNSYGMSKKTLFQRMSQERNKATGRPEFPGLSEKQTDYWWDRFMEFSPKTKAWHAWVERKLMRDGWVEDYRHGRKRFTTEMKEGCNHMIQAGGRAHILEAILAYHAERPRGKHGQWAGLFGDTHDWIAAYEPVSEVDAARTLMLRVMTCHDDPRVSILPDPDNVVTWSFAQTA